MNSLIAKLFEKRGIQELTELSVEEKKDLDRWQKTLSEGEITVEKIERFCRQQIKVIENEWKTATQARIDHLVQRHIVYTAILGIITEPAAEKENLERYLSQLIDS